MNEKLALLGGTPALNAADAPRSLLRWPIMTEEDEAAALEVIRANSFSGLGITQQFESEICQWLGCKHALAFCNGTMSLAAAMFSIGLTEGDEIICPTKTYWASIVHAVNLGANVVFCNIDENLSLDPADLERCITPRTKAIMVVHYLSYPADMDPIMEIARKYNLKVIEDVSHAQGGLYKGKRLGTFGDVAAMSMMSGKTFAAGELGMLITNDRRCYERAVAYCHYARFNDSLVQECPELQPYKFLPLGGMKGRANQLCTAMARVQLKYYDARCVEVRKAMNYFYDLMEQIPGIRPLRIDESTGSNMAGFYYPHVRYFPEELHGLPVEVFCEAVRAEGVRSCYPGANFCLHDHAFFKNPDPQVMGVVANREYPDNSACDASIPKECFCVPRFVELNTEWIEKYAAVFRKVAENHMELLGEQVNGKNGRWFGQSG